MDKKILEMSNDEILEELRLIIGNDVELPGRETIGFITNNKSDYFKDNIVDEEKLKEIYNKNDKLLKEYALTLSINSLRNRKKDLFDLIKDQKEGYRVLDYGCGVGTHGIACAEKGCDVSILDISEFMLNIAKKRFDNRNLTVVMYTESKFLPTDWFNTVICTDVIEHVPRPDLMLIGIIKCLKSGGVAHLHISKHVCYERGHLKQSIDIWENECQKILDNNFIKISENNYKLK